MKPLDLVKDIQSENHYLRRPSISYDSYLSDLCQILDKLEKIIDSTKYRELIEKKLQISLSKFDESQFIQAACELTVMSHFLDKGEVGFEYEKEVTKPKNVDFCVTSNGKNYNIEVKCPAFREYKKEANEIEFNFTSRTPSIKDKDEIVRTITSRLEGQGKILRESKNLDNTMKDFLILTQEKVRDSSINDVNVLVIGCHKEVNMHTWREYLFGYSGFFTEHSYIPHNEFNRVDYVLLTNIYNRHHRYFNSSKIKNHWELSSSFNLLYRNKFSLRNKIIVDQADLTNINSIFPNHNIGFERYLSDKTDLPEGENQVMKELALGIAWYSDKFKKDGIYYFQ